jgi:hypothetical protein
MTAAEKSFVGLAKQTAKGTPNVTDAEFKYLLFTQGGMSASSLTTPLDVEVGGGALLRDVLKTGVFSGGQLQLIPRPDTLGMALMGVLGKVVSADGGDGSFKHTFSLDPLDDFSAPYYTGRASPGGMWGESFQDMRFTTLALAFRGGRFLTGSYGLVGGLPGKVATAGWSAATKVDGTPPFLSAIADIEVPVATKLSVLSGSFIASSAIPMDEQWVVGSYSPEGLDITQRAFALQLAVKISDDTLFTKMQYDPAAGSSWVASMFREANFKIDFKSAALAAAAKPYSITIKGNGDSGDTAPNRANVVWTAQPITMQAGRNIVMAITGTFLADPEGDEGPISIELVNQTTAY